MESYEGNLAVFIVIIVSFSFSIGYCIVKKCFTGPVIECAVVIDTDGVTIAAAV
jgi:hypothetical protein